MSNDSNDETTTATPPPHVATVLHAIEARGWAAKWRLMGWGCVESTTYRHPFPWEPGYIHPEDIEPPTKPEGWDELLRLEVIIEPGAEPGGDQ